MERLRRSWHKLLNLGSCAGMTPNQQDRIRMVNLIACLCIPPTLFFSLVNLLSERPILSAINLSNSLCTLATIFFQYKKKPTIARDTLLISNFAFFLAGAVFFSNGAEYFLLCIMILAMLMYEDRRVHAVYGAAVIISMSLIFLSEGRLSAFEAVPRTRAVFNLVCALAFIIFITNYFLRTIYKNMDDIQSQKRKLQQVNLEKEKIISILAHDVRAPFVNLENLIWSLNEQLISNSVSKVYIKDIQESLHRQTEVLDTLLRWGSSSQNGLSQRMEQFPLKAMIDEAAGVYRDQIKAKDLTIVCKLEETDIVMANRDQILIVFRNLIGNAIKFSYRQGTIELTATRKAGMRYVHILDHGTGMDKTALETVFRLPQGKSLGTHNEKGNGMGLLLCSDLVERNHGRIQVNSSDAGTVFSVALQVGHPKGSTGQWTGEPIGL